MCADRTHTAKRDEGPAGRGGAVDAQIAEHERQFREFRRMELRCSHVKPPKGNAGWLMEVSDTRTSEMNTYLLGSKGFRTSALGHKQTF
jgi:hypothetical protein